MNHGVLDPLLLGITECWAVWFCRGVIGRDPFLDLICHKTMGVQVGWQGGEVWGIWHRSFPLRGCGRREGELTWPYFSRLVVLASPLGLFPPHPS